MQWSRIIKRIVSNFEKKKTLICWEFDHFSYQLSDYILVNKLNENISKNGELSRVYLINFKESKVQYMNVV